MKNGSGLKLTDAVSLGQTEDVRLLIQKGADVNEADEFGNYAAIIAASRNDLETLKVLVEAKVNLTVFNKSGENALFWASCNKNHEMENLIRKNLPKSPKLKAS